MEKNEKGKMSNLKKILIGAGIGVISLAIVGGLYYFLSGPFVNGIDYVGLSVAGACGAIGISVVAVVRDLIKNISYEYVDEEEEFEEEEETNEKECDLHLVKNRDVVIEQRYNYEYKSDAITRDNTPKLEIINPSNGYSRKKKK